MSSLPTEVPNLQAAAVSVSFLRKMILQRHLIWNFVVRDLRTRYVGSLMGLFWSVIHPLVLLVSYTFVFTMIFQIRPGAAPKDSFALFLFCGILPWLYFQDTVVRSCHSVVEQSGLIRKTLFPSEILPVTVVLSNVVTHLIGVGVLLTVLVFLKPIGWAVLTLPLYFSLLVLFSLGLGWLVAALQVFLRDMAQILSVLMVFWFWFTPIFYEVERVPHPYRYWILLNPLSHVVGAYRCVLLENQLPDPVSLLLLAGYAAAMFVVGGVVFRNTKREFVDVL